MIVNEVMICYSSFYLRGREIELEQASFGARERFGGDLVVDLQRGGAGTLRWWRRREIEKEWNQIRVSHTQTYIHVQSGRIFNKNERERLNSPRICSGSKTTASRHDGSADTRYEFSFSGRLQKTTIKIGMRVCVSCTVCEVYLRQVPKRLDVVLIVAAKGQLRKRVCKAARAGAGGVRADLGGELVAEVFVRGGHGRGGRGG